MTILKYRFVKFLILTICSIVLTGCVTEEFFSPSKKLIHYDYSFYFENINDNKIPNIKLNEKYKNQYEFLILPVDLKKPHGENFKLRVFHANPEFKKADKVFIFANGGPGDAIDEEFSIKRNEALGSDWDFIEFDHRGCALSTMKTNREKIDLKYLTIEQSAEDLHAIVQNAKKAGAKKIVVGGYSAGAILTLQYSIKYWNEVDLIYIDAGAPTADFMQISDKKAIKLISETFYPDTIEKIAMYYELESNLFSEVLTENGSDCWIDFKDKNNKADDILKNWLSGNILVPPFVDRNELIEDIVSSDRLYYTVACLEYLPQKQDKILSYTALEDYYAMADIFVNKFGLTRKPFDFTNDIPEIKTKTIITNGLNDYVIPFECSKKIHKLINNRKSILFGVKNTGHTVISTDIYPFIMEIIKTFLETNSPVNVKNLIRSNDKLVLYK